MASINKIDKNKYQIVVSYTGKDGKRKFKYKTVTGTLKQAKTVAVEFEEQIKVSDYTDGHLIKFKNFAEKWLAEIAINSLTPATFENYVKTLDKRIFAFVGNKYMSDIKPADLQRIIIYMQEQDYHIKTIKRTFGIVNGIFKYAYTLGYIEANPSNRVVFPKNTKTDNKIHYFTKEQAKIFLGLLKQEHIQYQIYFNLALYGGFRRGELVALTWNDIDAKNKQISINKAIHKYSGGEMVKEPKTRGSIRDVVVPDVCFELLEKWREINKNEYVFIQKNGERMCIDTPSHKFNEILKIYNTTAEIPLPVIRLHDLRHTSATLLLGNNVDIETVSARLGHTLCSTTLDIYGHALKDNDIKASNVLDTIL